MNGVNSDFKKKSFDFKLACSACSSIFKGHVDFAHEKRTHYLVERILLMPNLRNMEIGIETAYSRTGMVLVVGH